MSTTNVSLSATAVRDKILSAKGRFVKAAWKSNPKPAAAFKDVLLEKHTVAVVQAGVDYANLSSVKQGIADGTRGEVQPLSWGEWYTDPITGKSWFPYVIKHKDEFYIRLTTSTASNHHANSVFFVNGEEVTKDEFAKYLTPSEAKKLLNPTPEDTPPVFNIKLNNILAIPEDVD